MEFSNSKLEKECLGFPVWLNYEDYPKDCMAALRVLCKEPYDLFAYESHRLIHEGFKYFLAHGASPNEANIKMFLMNNNKWDESFDDTLTDILWEGKAPICLEAGLRGDQYMEFLLKDLRSLRWMRNCFKVVQVGYHRLQQANQGNFREAMLDLVADSQLAFTDSSVIRDTSPKSFSDAVYISKTEARIAEELGKAPVINTGFEQLDFMSGGFKPGDLVILAGRTSMGKSALALDIALNVAKLEKDAVIVFSLEMTNTENIKRILTKITQEPVKSLDASESMADRMMPKHRDLPLFFDDSPASPTEIELRSDEIVNSLPVGTRLGLIVVDHLQLLGVRDKTRYESRNRQLSAYTSELKTLAKKLGCVVLALSQVNRSSQRDKRPPVLSDLRESGTIEENADLVMGIYRPGVDQGAQESSREAVLAILKNRHGATGNIELFWTPDLVRFTDGGGEPRWQKSQ